MLNLRQGPQRRAVEALIALGSSPESMEQGSSYVLISKPFHQDRTPSVEVFADGGYRDYAGSGEWASLGLKHYGTYLDLERASEDRWGNLWNSLPYLSARHIVYLAARHIKSDLFDLRSDGNAVCFPLWKDGKMVGIQRRYIDGTTPKCRLFAGSDASGLFRPEDKYTNTRIFFVCEGVTDTYSLASRVPKVIGLVSASTTEGLSGMFQEPQTENIVLCMDNDAAGREAERRIVLRFPSIQFKRLVLGQYKDVNELLCAGGELRTEDIAAPAALEFLSGPKSAAPDGVWVGWWPPDLQGKRWSWNGEKAEWLIFPPDYDRAKARQMCWEQGASGYVAKED